VAWGRALVLVALAAMLGGGCGSGGHDFTASEFVDRINAEGLKMVLGERLPGGAGARELYAVSLPPLPGEPAPPSGSEGGPGASGTLYVYADSGGASDELDACRRSGGLLCFRAANIVVVLSEEGTPLEARRLALAIKKLAE
jgi:hypothetical protein